jgi:hypothetical protein
MIAFVRARFSSSGEIGELNRDVVRTMLFVNVLAFSPPRYLRLLPDHPILISRV